MPVLIHPKVRLLKWAGDAPRFREIQLDRDGKPLLVNGQTVPTGRVLKGVAARKLIEEVNRVHRRAPAIEVRTRGGGPVGDADVYGSLPPNWELDNDWENAPPGAKGFVFKGGRRHALPRHSERGVTRADTMDMKFVAWWKQVYPDTPYHPISRDYYWYINTEFITEVHADDVPIIVLGCVGEFFDVTHGDPGWTLERPILLVDEHRAR